MNIIKSRILLRKIYFSGLVLLPLVLIILPANFFDNGQSLCLSVILFNVHCLGCGMTRAIQHIIHLDFVTAYSFNKLSVIVFPILAGLWIKEVIQVYKKIKSQNH